MPDQLKTPEARIVFGPEGPLIQLFHTPPEQKETLRGKILQELEIFRGRKITEQLLEAMQETINKTVNEFFKGEKFYQPQIINHRTAARTLNVPEDWAIFYMSTEVEHLDYHWQEILQAHQEQNGSMCVQDVETLLEPITHSFVLPKNRALVGMQSPGGNKKKYGLVNFGGGLGEYETTSV